MQQHNIFLLLYPFTQVVSSVLLIACLLASIVLLNSLQKCIVAVLRACLEATQHEQTQSRDKMGQSDWRQASV
jgi:hypothetical protein